MNTKKKLNQNMACGCACYMIFIACNLLPKDAFLTQAIVSQNLPELGIEPRSLSQLLHEKVFFFKLPRLCFISYAESI
jgi:hypothetical protein